MNKSAFKSLILQTFTLSKKWIYNNEKFLESQTVLLNQKTQNPTYSSMQNVKE